MKREVLFAHPENSDLTWTGYGRRPKWVEAWLAQGSDMSGLALKNPDRLAQVHRPKLVTVTTTPTDDQAQLPGLPPLPKKRGRPATGQAMTAAERKRKSRMAMRDKRITNYQDLTDSQLIEALAIEFSAAKQNPAGEDRDSCKWLIGHFLQELQVRAGSL